MRKFNDTDYGLIGFITVMILMLLLSSCNKELKLAKKCAELFPVKDSLVIEERIITDTLMIPDTWVEYLDTTICLPDMDTVIIIKPVIKKVPGRAVLTERIVFDTIIIQESSARLSILNHQIDALHDQKSTLELKLAKSKGKTNIMMWIIISIIGISGVLLWLKK